jgi:tRNA pseudouridine55 synthase
VTESEKGAFFLVNKPLDWTSFDVVNKLRYILKTKKVGHAGTLDPLATGLLIICAAKMTKRIEEFQGLEKEYVGTIVLGQTTPSYDLETIPSMAVSVDHITDDRIRAEAQSFIGLIQQIPPAHSSIKVNGQRAYSLARKGKDPALKAREVEIREFEITEIKKPEVAFRVVCSKGTYIRSLANDLGAALGVGGYLSSLCRTRIGTYRLEDAETLEEIRNRFIDQ